MLLMQSADFAKAMKALDAPWQPVEARIDPALRAKVCPS